MLQVLPHIGLRGWRNIVEIVLFEISSLMNLYPLLCTRIPVNWGPLKLFLSRTNSMRFPAVFRQPLKGICICRDPIEVVARRFANTFSEICMVGRPQDTGVCENTHFFLRAFAFQNNSTNCSPPPDFVFFKPMLPRLFLSRGVFLFTDTGPVWCLFMVADLPGMFVVAVCGRAVGRCCKL